MRVLIISKIFPNRFEPLSAPFNRQQFTALSQHCEVEVLATIPYFPGIGAARRFSAAGRLTSVPRRDVIGGLSVSHPRTLYIPKLGHRVADRLHAASLLGEVMSRRHRSDVLLGSWGFPDGCGAVRLSHWTGVPAVVKVHGSDINVLGKRPGPRRAMERWLPRAARIVAVSRALKNEVANMGVDPEKIDVVRNGVDKERFRPRDSSELRRRVGFDPRGKLVLYVGRLERAKGVAELLDAFETGLAFERDVTLALIGEGELLPRCEALALRYPGRLRILGSRPLPEVASWIGASDLLTLPSHAEGTPNVVLEALASGRRVVATRVGGIPEVIRSEATGLLVEPRDPRALLAALQRALRLPYDGHAVAAAAGIAGWDESAAQLCASLDKALQQRSRWAPARPNASCTHSGAVASIS